MELIIDLDSFRYNPTGPSTGGIYFEFGENMIFPGKGWNDFVDVILTWWIDALSGGISSKKAFEMDFMDGPFKLIFSNSLLPGFWKIDLVENDRVNESITRSKTEVVTGFYQTVNWFLRLASDSGWRNPEIDLLQKSFLSFQKLRKNDSI